MDIRTIEELIEVLESSSTEELSVRRGECTVRIRKGRPAKAAGASVPAQAPRPSEPPAEAPAPAVNEYLIRAPMVGIFHCVDGIATAGARVAAGQVVGAIESMKLLNDVICEVSGKVAEVMVEDGMPVEYGQNLCRIEPE